jgi:hypothetical protein
MAGSSDTLGSHGHPSPYAHATAHVLCQWQCHAVINGNVTPSRPTFSLSENIYLFHNLKGVDFVSLGNQNDGDRRNEKDGRQEVGRQEDGRQEDGRQEDGGTGREKDRS